MFGGCGVARRLGKGGHALEEGDEDDGGTKANEASTCRYDQRQKEMNLPTSDEEKKAE